MVKDKINFILIFFLILGISLLLYPTVADIWNASRSTKIINEYDETLAKLDRQTIEKQWEKAQEYNKKLATKPYSSEMSKKELEEYYQTLKVGNSDVMAVVEIPSINIRLPIYHGSEDKVLQSAIGHIEWTSLPVGGESTHSVITGHRGLVSARLFTDIDQLAPEDIFSLRVLNRKLLYKVDEITIVEPHEIENLFIKEGKDYVTLLTCTPYGINTHRLLVRGHRIKSEVDMAEVSADAIRIKPFIIASIITVPGAFLLGAVTVAFDRKRRK